MDTARPKKTFSRYKEPSFPLNDILAFQEESYGTFLDAGLKSLFEEFFPIEDSNNRYKISFVSHRLEEPRLSPQKAKESFTSYTAPLRVVLHLNNTVTKRVVEEEVLFGDIPMMTPQRSFIINGVERTIVSQLIRSQGIRFFKETKRKTRDTFGAQVVPQKGKGIWLVFESDVNGLVSVRVDQSSRRLPITTFIRAFGPETQADVLKLFADDPAAHKSIEQSFADDTATTMDEVWLAFYKVLRSGSVVSPERAKEMVQSRFSPEWYNISEIGRINFNKRFSLPITEETKDNLVLNLEDIVVIVKEIVRLNNTPGAEGDDIDHLGFRRIRSVGELVYEHARTGFIRVRKNVRDKMLTQDPKLLELPTNVINLRTFQSTIHGFFNTDQLSQTLKQQNVLDQLEHLRTISALGAGGVTREHANVSVRDVHRTHYGRICPINTPERGNIGLVLHLALYARINEYGLLECPYNVVKGGKVTDEIAFMTAAEDERYKIAGADVETDGKGSITQETVLVRHDGQYDRVSPQEVDYVDAATGQILSIASALVPFASNTIPYRSATGTRMQQQAIPCLRPEKPLIATGYEEAFARSSGRLMVAEEDGEVVSVDAKHIAVKSRNDTKRYDLEVFKLAGSAYTFANHQRPSVSLGDKVKKGDVLADIASTVDGSIAVGKNLRVAFLPYDSTFNDAIIVSERLVHDDVLTSIQVKEHVVDVRETKLGPDVMTADIPNVPERKLRNLGLDGVIRVGSEVVPGDILVGKLTPRGEMQMSAEEHLLLSIFGDKAKDMRDTSKTLPPGEQGKVVSVQVRDRESDHMIDMGVLKQVHIIVADLRRVKVGDKLANRYGNKGVISRIAPIEDMPFTSDGEPIDIILSSLGVPSRKNIGQVLEMHLGLAAHAQGYQAIVPPMTSITEDELRNELVEAGYPESGQVDLYDGKTGDRFAGDVSIGWVYTLKLEHMVQDKVHARSTGRYSLITQQPPGGRSRFGGGRLGEMEVWALLGHGAAHTLREMLTIKSDDMHGRNIAYNAIIRKKPIVQTGTPAAFNVLLYYLRGLGLNVTLDTADDQKEPGPVDKIQYT
ncbi:MAG: DNA-directed RNA polymerase subunit beta [Candidatus Kaiserbacteria bacterium]|nr:DNA-directed RNA polymerase subunit beta [Candidatus Kaiserbacteria bacterium]